MICKYNNTVPAAGDNTYTATAEDGQGHANTATINVHLPQSSSYAYDLNGNLLSDGRRHFDYDDENQLTAVTVSNVWRSEFVYDGKMRRRIPREYNWQSGSSGWQLAAEVDYIYDGNLVIQVRLVADDLPHGLVEAQTEDLDEEVNGRGHPVADQQKRKRNEEIR